MTTHFVCFLDCCRQALTFTTAEARDEYKTNHTCEEENNDE